MSNENEITLTIDFEPFLGTEDGDGIVGLLIREAGRQLAARVVYERAPQVRDEAAGLIAEMLREKLRPQVEEVLKIGIRKSAYGEPVSVPEFIAETVAKQLTVHDRQGSFRSERTLLENLLCDEIERTVAKELRETMNAAKQKVQEAVEAEGAKVIRETIERLAKGQGV